MEVHREVVGVSGRDLSLVAWKMSMRVHDAIGHESCEFVTPTCRLQVNILKTSSIFKYFDFIF
jgi:hypothetical protein